MFARLLAITLLALPAASARAQRPAPDPVQTGVLPGITTPVQNTTVQGNGKPATPTQPLTVQGLRILEIPQAKPGPTSVVPPPAGYQIIPFATPPTLSPGVILLAQLDGEFQDAVLKGGGKAFNSFLAEDAVILDNGRPASMGRGALDSKAYWDPATYKLTWVLEGAQMGPSNDMGFTWGFYTAQTFAPGSTSDKPASIATGRFITIWKKQKDGAWKVAMDASADAPASSPGLQLAAPATRQ